jgi:hypothetical protein
MAKKCFSKLECLLLALKRGAEIKKKSWDFGRWKGEKVSKYYLWTENYKREGVCVWWRINREGGVRRDYIYLSHITVLPWRRKELNVGFFTSIEAY